MALHNESSQEREELFRESWPTLPSLPPLLGPTVPTIGHQFFIHSPSTIFKLGTDDGEGVMTSLAHSILGFCVPRIVSVVTLSSRASDTSMPTRAQQGLVLTRQPGTPLVELWPSLTALQREAVKANLCRLLVHMRARHFAYYGRPTREPYLLFSEFGTETHACCSSRSEWDDSRVRALHASAPDTERAVALERVQRGTTGAGGWDRPVLTHGDLSDRNILVDPHTLAVTGFLDWEMANIMPAYFEYVAARLSGGHQPEWRRELLDVLRSVLRRECDARRPEYLSLADVDELEGRYRRTIAAWDAVVDVERIAQGYDDDCAWTFETSLPDASEKTGLVVR
ncbi:hypothetical protein AJ78_08611 [Emergomyces pasteurianus Ep9510]|uniref:Aminoglycoside phosphotransferase domain-containing protein n=1 Tax=Emergomyces pasteurianus Ep9510 TaxID=1447872 RepID=A0A1J9PR46_9EURO|nr:hypothetical protein AJ78_08611 [Emergomyces pasteurianus Ep9510]